MKNNKNNKSTPLSRRDILKTSKGLALSAATASSFPIIFAKSAQAFTNDPKDASKVTFGFNAPLTGPYAAEGEDQFRAFQLAIKHINGTGNSNGVLETMKPLALKGNGVLGKQVGYVHKDSRLNAEVAVDNAKSMIRNDGALMISGGSSSSSAIAVQALCQEAGAIFMAGATHSNDTTGKDRKKNGFRYMCNAYITAASLAPVLAQHYGTDRKAFQLSADYTWGHTMQQSMIEFTDRLGWETVGTQLTPLKATDFSEYMDAVVASDADVLILNHYGANFVDSLAAAIQAELKDRVVNGKQFEIVVPLYSRLMAQGAGRNAKGVFGAVDWHWSLQDPGTKAFVSAYALEYGMPPSQTAHVIYAQTMLYADACERAGTFNPCGVIEALEDFQFDGLGGGPSLYRAKDHQCFKQVYIVRGKANPASKFDVLEIVETVPVEKTYYSPDNPMFAGGTLGVCNSGV